MQISTPKVTMKAESVSSVYFSLLSFSNDLKCRRWIVHQSYIGYRILIGPLVLIDYADLPWVGQLGVAWRASVLPRLGWCVDVRRGSAVCCAGVVGPQRAQVWQL